MKKQIKVALTGNPNCGKTTIFNVLTKSRQKIGNYPGVTVERKEGFCKFNDNEIKIIDLPGTHSLTSHSEEEIIARDYILDEKPDVIVNIVDASSLERSLYLTTQLMELQVPIILVCNKVDLAKKHQIDINFDKLASLLEVEVVTTIGVQKKGIDKLLEKILCVMKKKEMSKGIYLNFSEDIENLLQTIEGLLENKEKPRWKAIKLLESDTHLREQFNENIISEVNKIKDIIKNKYGHSFEEVIAEKRQKVLSHIVKDIIVTTNEHGHAFSDKIDKIFTNKYFGIPIFLIFIYLIFQFTFTFGAYPSNFLQTMFQKLSLAISQTWQSESLFRSLLVDGIIGGVGIVLSFVPNILILFIAISVLEETGYMARVALIMDRIMHKIGLHGKSFLPMLMGFGCSVPAIMSTRILENKRDKLTTILVLPLIACSAKLAVFTLFLPAFFSPTHSAIILFLLYLIGILTAIGIIKILRKTIFKGENIPFIMEMPPYQMPSFKNITISTWQKAGVYVKKAGSLILFISIILWFLSVFPINNFITKEYKKDFSIKQKQMLLQIDNLNIKTPNDVEASNGLSLDDRALKNKLKQEFIEQSKKQEFIRSYKLDFFRKKELFSALSSRLNLKQQVRSLQKSFNEEVTIIKNDKNEKQLSSSYMGKIGRMLEPIFKPLGFDWKIDTALIGAFSAKEIFLTQLDIIYLVGEESEGSSSLLRNKLKKHYSSFEGFTIMLFILISAPCMATIAMTKKETNSYKWAIVQLLLLTILAYVMTLGVYQIGRLF